MKRATIADIHLDGFVSDTLDKSGLPQRLGYIIKSLEYVVSECRKRNIKHIDILGDLIHTKSLMYTVAIDAFKSFLLRNSDIDFLILSGNHDFHQTGAYRKSAVSVFSGYSNVKCVIDAPEMIDGMLVAPFSETLLEDIKSYSSKILLCHIGLNEAVLSSGLSHVDHITLANLSAHQLILSGHYHKPQSISNGRSVIYFSGSLCPRDWNDKGQEFRFLVYDTETLEVESIPLNCGIPQFIEYTINDISEKSEVLKNAEIATNNGHHVRIRNKTTEKIKEEVSGPVLVIEQKEVDVTNRGINITMSKEDQLKKFLEIRQIPENERSEYLDLISKYDLLRKVE
jgi:DNA repair exonuclease SbcCD nuclease subunit